MRSHSHKKKPSFVFVNKHELAQSDYATLIRFTTSLLQNLHEGSVNQQPLYMTYVTYGE
jgi:hypothetical protein